MCSFDCENVHKRRCTICVLMNDPHWMKSLGVCDEFPNGCNPHKDQVLST